MTTTPEPTNRAPSSPATLSPPAADVKKKPKPCCACPETKQPRDECILMRGESDVKCKELIQAHRACMRQYGYEI
jgi:cytochrome c oxidase assembly protein subunit 17